MAINAWYMQVFYSSLKYSSVLIACCNSSLSSSNVLSSSCDEWKLFARIFTLVLLTQFSINGRQWEIWKKSNILEDTFYWNYFGFGMTWPKLCRNIKRAHQNRRQALIKHISNVIWQSSGSSSSNVSCSFASCNVQRANGNSIPFSYLYDNII